MKRLFAGPWIGEFGWEVMAWQGYLRAISSKYDQIVVCGPSGHAGMYEFANKYISFDASTLKANMWMNRPFEEKANKQIQMYIGPHEFSNNGHIEWVNPTKLWDEVVTEHKGMVVYGVGDQLFKPFKGDADGYDILYHARNRDDWDSSYRNWGPEHCASVLDELQDLKIGCIGRTDRAFHISGTADLRDIPLSKLTAIMSNSKVFVGPISGPTHLATLCGLPQMTWAVKAEHEERVRKTWNPFNTRVEVIYSGSDDVWKNRISWTPTANDIISGIRKVLK